MSLTFPYADTERQSLIARLPRGLALQTALPPDVRYRLESQETELNKSS
jgi:hypothetical protein